jgi:hypothetical protein
VFTSATSNFAKEIHALVLEFAVCWEEKDHIDMPEDIIPLVEG